METVEPLARVNKNQHFKLTKQEASQGATERKKRHRVKRVAKNREKIFKLRVEISTPS